MGEETKESVKQNLTLVELIVGIVILGIIAEIPVLIFAVGKRLSYSLSLFVGVLTAIWMAVHMKWSIDSAFDYDAKTAVKHMQKNSLLRYAVALVVLAIAGYSGYFNVVLVFVGMIFLKIAAYAQPLVHKPMVKIFGELPPGPSLPDDEEEETSKEIV